MLLPRIITLSIIGVLFLIDFGYTLYLYIKNNDEYDFRPVVAYILRSAGIILLVLASISYLIEIDESIQKCPEYERIENVYRLKQ